MLLTIENRQFEDVGVGTYQCSFSGMEEIETKKGLAYRWEFKAHDGQTISGLSDANTPPSTKNKTGRWLSALSGKPLTAGTQIDPDQFIGKRYLVIVAAGDNGRTKLETFSPLN